MKSFRFLLLILCTLDLKAQSDIPELGYVHWQRSFDKAQQISKKENKPILILFQEIPGCSTCKKFGNSVMSHPFVVDAIESFFVPLAIYNNKGGDDKKILDKYGEPAWNNPVIRVVDENGDNLMDRANGLYTLDAMVPYLRNAILKSGNLVPAYFQILEDELTASPKDITLEMYCFWTGEKELGKLNGVINTEAGYSNGKEVVKVTFDANKTSSKNVVDQAHQANVADAIHLEKNENIGKNSIPSKSISNYHPDGDIHYYLKKSNYAGIPMTKMQATKTNSLIGQGLSPETFLSPSQLKLHQKNKNQNVIAYLNDVYTIWKML